MNKETFLEELRGCLRGEVTEEEYEESLAYYRQYIDDQAAQGMREEEITASLGSPRLIARSIIDAHGLEEAGGAAGGYYDAERERYSSGNESDIQEKATGIARKIGVMVIVICVLLVLGAIIKVLLPFVLIMIIAIFVLNIFRRE